MAYASQVVKALIFNFLQSLHGAHSFITYRYYFHNGLGSRFTCRVYAKFPDKFQGLQSLTKLLFSYIM